MANKKIRIGIIGCGTIGAQLARAIEKELSSQAQLSAVCDLDKNKAKKLSDSCVSAPKVLSIDAVIGACDLIIEAAAAEISASVAQKALGAGKDVMIMSVGGILGEASKLFALAQRKRGHLYLPSGAIAGLDAVKAAGLAKIKQATLTTRKPPAGLAGAPYLVERKIDLSRLKEEQVIFEGTAAEAIKGFPKNVNVCVTLSLAGIGPEKTRVKIIASPNSTANIHEIQLEGDFGKLTSRTENLPSPGNPRTSFLAYLSALATLKSILNPVKIGT